MNQPTQPLEYSTPVPSARVRFPIRWTAAVAAATFVGVIVPLLTKRKFEGIFKDLSVQLPGSTVLLLRFSRWFTDDFGWLVVGINSVTLLAGGIILAYLRPSAFGARRERWAARAVWLLALAYGTFAAYALFMPLIRLIDTVNGGATKGK